MYGIDRGQYGIDGDGSDGDDYGNDMSGARVVLLPRIRNRRDRADGDVVLDRPGPYRRW